MKVYWNPAELIRPESEQTKNNVRHTTFQPSYEREEPRMGLILSWHYGRQWLEERQTHEKSMNKIIKKSTKFIQPDFSKWLEKRKLTKTRRQRASFREQNIY